MRKSQTISEKIMVSEGRKIARLRLTTRLADGASAFAVSFGGVDGTADRYIS